jgi:hypothetical protein
MADKANYALQDESLSIGFKTTFACLTFSQSDRIRFVNFPKKAIRDLETVITNIWPKGIQDSKPFGMGHEVKLRGNPWGHGGGLSEESINAYKFLTCIMKILYDSGWILKTTGSIGQNGNDKGQEHYYAQQNSQT